MDKQWKIAKVMGASCGKQEFWWSIRMIERPPKSSAVGELWLSPGADLGGFCWTPILKQMRYYKTLTWPQNAGNPILKDLSLKRFPREDAPGAPGGGLLYKKDGAACRKFWKEPLRATKILFCRRGLNFLYPPRGTNSYTTHYLLSYFFSSIP